MGRSIIRARPAGWEPPMDAGPDGLGSGRFVYWLLNKFFRRPVAGAPTDRPGGFSFTAGRRGPPAWPAGKEIGVYMSGTCMKTAYDLMTPFPGPGIEPPGRISRRRRPDIIQPGRRTPADAARMARRKKGKRVYLCGTYMISSCVPVEFAEPKRREGY